MPTGPRVTRSITLGLITGGLAALAYGTWEHHRNATTGPSDGSGSRYGYTGWHSFSSNSHPSFHSGTSHGGFGSTGHASS